MIQTREQTRRSGPASRAQFTVAIKLFSALAIVVSLMALWPAQADEPEDHYLRIMTLIEQADSVNTNSQAGLALAKYQKAQIALRDFQKTYPTWNVKLVSYRSKNLAERVATLSAPPAPPAEGDTPTGTPGTKTGGAASTTQVKLLEAGAEPRKVLRMHPKPGDKQTLGMVMKMGIEMNIGETQIPAMKLPAMTMTMDLTVKTVAADGDITFDMIMSEASVAEDPDVLPQVAEAMKSSLEKIKGLSGTATMSNRGVSKGTDVKTPADADPQLRQTLEQMKESFGQFAVPLPEEAVGPGARWEVKMPFKSQGMTINQTTTYQLASIEGERVSARSIIAQNASNQKMQNPAMPGLKIDLKKMDGKGTGEVTLDLAQVRPAQGNTDSHSQFSMEMNTGGQKQAMTMKMDLNIRLEGK